MDEEYNSDGYAEIYNDVVDEIVNTFISNITNRYLVRNYLIENNINTEFNFDETYESLFNNLDIDYNYNRILQETFENQPSIEKTDHIVDIPSQKYSSIKEKEKYELECCICLTQFDEDCIVSLLPKCHHILHKECMIEWGKYKSSCPICRNNVEEEKS
jgi:hypothetical protein